MSVLFVILESVVSISKVPNSSLPPEQIAFRGISWDNDDVTKTFTCLELGGICDEKFSGETFMDIVNKGMGHMMSDEAHKAKIINMEAETGESKEQWMEKMQNEFDGKPEDK